MRALASPRSHPRRRFSRQGSNVRLLFEWGCGTVELPLWATARDAAVRLRLFSASAFESACSVLV